MTQALDGLVQLLGMETLEENLFRGHSQDLGFPQLFGGQVLGQALSAASQTVDPARRVHSLHGYFLLAGDPHHPVVYQVDRVRDGGSFATRRVSAIQHGKTIFFCSASFHIEESGFHHQPTRPPVATPDELIAEGLASARDTGAAVAAVPVNDTIKSAGPDMIVANTVDRDGLWAVQTPQVFRADLLVRAHREVSDDSTDDAAMVERIGGAVRLFMGSYENVKVTTADDLTIAAAILKARSLA